jgi:hypothetical protein
LGDALGDAAGDALRGWRFSSWILIRSFTVHSHASVLLPKPLVGREFQIDLWS